MTGRHAILNAAKLATLLAAILILPSCKEKTDSKPQMIILGFDGLDARLMRRMLDENRLPNFAKLAAQGDFKPLGTSIPPHSPVAWSSIITGTDPGKHGIFDWIHRNPETYMPFLATTDTISQSGMTLPVGKWVFPITGGGKVVNLRFGEPFWNYLVKNSVNAHVYRIPANYPPEKPKGPGEFLTLTDMGTPDLIGTQGEFAFYTSGSTKKIGSIGGGSIHRLLIRPIGGNVARGKFYGPPDPLLNPDRVGQKNATKKLEVDFTVFRDKSTDTAYIEWNNNRVLLNVGEWSDWHTLEFDMGPLVAGISTQTMTGTVKLLLKQVQPTIQLYVSPIQIDPENPALPISIPAEFASEVAESVGRYYSQGLPEDTKALSNEILTRDEFLDQAEIIYQERLRLLDFALDRYNDGFMFFYFGTTDQIGHMFWGAMADSHPALTPEDTTKYEKTMENLYVRVDKVVGKVMKRFPDATIMCISDHGFANFARGLNVNTWLANNGYATLASEDRTMPMNFDWEKTRAYAVGINGLYINEKGREGKGIVDSADKQALMDEITAKMLGIMDTGGRRVIKVVYHSDKVFSPDHLDIAPDMIIGYELGFRGSWATALGSAPEAIIEDNRDAWCGDHCIAADLVPGVVISNKPVLLENPHLEDIAPTILDQYGIRIPKAMNGSNIFKKNRSNSMKK